MPTNSLNGRLDSWKDIAAYLGRDVRTAMRWEKEKGLPVRRVPGGQRQAVFAYTTELDAWLGREDSAELGAAPQGLKSAVEKGRVIAALEALRHPKPGSPRLRYYAAMAAVAVIVSLFALFGLRSRASGPSLPVRVRFTLNALQTFDDKERLLWTHKFPGVLDQSMLGQIPSLSSFSRVDDFRRNGDREVLVVAPVGTGPNSEDPVQVEVDLFSGRGELLWSYIPRGRFQFGEHDLNGPWTVGDVFVSSRAGRTQIWLAVIHQVWGNGFVVNLDPATGKDTLRFVNTGTIHALGEVQTHRGNFLLAGGFNNEGDSGSLAVIDEARPFAVSPQTKDAYKCRSCPVGDPDYYFIFPRSEINELEQVYEDTVTRIHVTDDQIEIRKNEVLDWSGPEAIYLLKADRGLRMVSRRFDSRYDMLHRKLEQEGRIRHTLEECPERLHPRPVRMWTPAGGWTEIGLNPGRIDE